LEKQKRVILIGGTSHAGKTTVARFLAEEDGWMHKSTDHLAKHPGRPWIAPPGTVPPHVVEHYLSLSGDELIASVIEHYRSLWLVIESLVREHCEDATKPRLVLEGSALMPANVVSLRSEGLSAVWITGDNHLLEARIHAESRYADADRTGKTLIDKFVERTLRFDRLIKRDAIRLGLPTVAADEVSSVEGLAQRCLAAMRRPNAAG